MSDRVQIRPYRPDDATALYEAARESVNELFPWMAWCHPDLTLEEVEAWTASRQKPSARGVEHDFKILDDAGRFLGGCGLNQINEANRFANLGYWVRTSATGRGVAAEAVRQLARFAFRETTLSRLEIVCAVGNIRSQRVAEKVGAVREGSLRDRLVLHGRLHDAILFSIVKSAWDADEHGRSAG